MSDEIHSDAAIAAALEASTLAIKAAREASDSARDAALVASRTAAEAISTARVKTWWQMSAQVAVWIVIILLAYGTVNTRLQVLEVKYDRIANDIAEMHADIKSLLRMQQQSQSGRP